MKRGVVRDKRRRIIALETGEDSYSILHLTSDDPGPDVGDEIEFPSRWGRGFARNVTRGEAYQVIVQNHDIRQEDLARQLDRS